MCSHTRSRNVVAGQWSPVLLMVCMLLTARGTLACHPSRCRGTPPRGSGAGPSCAPPAPCSRPEGLLLREEKEEEEAGGGRR